METHLSIVVRLQEALDELKAKQDQLDGIPDWMRELHERYSEGKAEIDALAEARDAAAAEHRGAEAEGSDLRAKLQNYQDQIGRVRNQREYSALLQEIDTVKQSIRGSEERALAALESQDESQKALEERQSEFSELNERYESELTKWEAQKPDVEKRVAALRQEVETLEQSLPRNVLDLFRRILDRHGGQAMALVQRVERVGKGPQIWSCAACNYRVRPQAVVEIANHGNLVLCDSCRRILHLSE